VRSGKGRLPKIAPQSTAEIPIDLPRIVPRADAEYHLNLEFFQGAKKAWASADHVIAREQFTLAWTAPVVAPLAPANQPALISVVHSASEHSTVVKGDGFALRLDDRTGQLSSYQVAGRELLVAPLHLNLWRPPTDNDRGNKMPEVTRVWREAGERAVVTSRVGEKIGGGFRLAYELSVPAGRSTATLVYLVAADGSVDVCLELRPAGDKLPVIPRVGLSVALVSALRQWTWFGRGPVENYSDRAEGYPLGVWSGDVAKLWFPYSEPQETGNRTGVRWASFLDAKGAGLRFRAVEGGPLEVGAYPFAQNDLQGARHPADIPLRDFVTVHVAHRQMGVGGEDSWGAWPRPDHVIKADKTYRYTFRIEPVVP
jgi:beta-galactosidase